ncbi:NAD(P)-dependent oxidoreductase [Natronomonas sp. F2-12]|uniref:NAD(P)-dependent oxidoreductase n=1 Tax=Natronomonas aquatica TaxID=2841590 RepID=A0A9R1D7C1_9EURY|nr:NAD(P)-dependent oxidoreductase [Natronomonas aquatica]MCQ4333145.1 NAD(P)-dependent oxidoreductase [Natronomonas aquatica]
MQVLVTGAGGLLGGAIARVARAVDISVLATYHTRRPEIAVTCEQLDITETDQFESLVRAYEPETVINCAAMTDVDGCEEHPEQARAVNGDAPGELAQVAARHDIGFMQISTDYVFSGEQERRYEPDDKTAPKQVYGRSKFRGEETVRAAHPSPWIVRLSFVYGRTEHNEPAGFPAWVLDRLERAESTPLFTDQYITPTRAESAAQTILKLAGKQAGETVHIAARDCITPYEFGMRLAEFTEHPTELLEEGSMADIDRAAARPKKTCLSVDRIESILGDEQPTFEADLRAFVHAIR